MGFGRKKHTGNVRQSKKDLRLGSDRKNYTAEKLLDYIENSGDFPDHELADNIEMAVKDNRRNGQMTQVINIDGKEVARIVKRYVIMGLI